MTIAPPKIANDCPDRPLECQFALEPAFQDLARQAQAAGWSDSEVAAALVDLSHNHMIEMLADEKTLHEIASAALALKFENRNVEAEDIEESEAEDVARIERETGEKA